MELSELIQSIDIVEYISQFIELEQRGEEWWGLSCFKNEKTPSFSVRREPPCFYDYSSGIGGNVFTFVRYYHHCSASAAVEILRKYVGFSGEIAAPQKKMAATMVCRRYQPPKTAEKTNQIR